MEILSADSERKLNIFNPYFHLLLERNKASRKLRRQIQSNDKDLMYLNNAASRRMLTDNALESILDENSL